MTWIAACSGQRGTYQEVIMADEADLQYLRNINTKPGPDAGRSINPAKPGPDDDAEPVRQVAMTDEERQGLIDDLRYVEKRDFEEHLPYSPTGQLCQKAADEIERLAKENETLRGECPGPDDTLPPLRYSDTAEKSPDGTETRRLEVDRQKLLTDEDRQRLIQFLRKRGEMENHLYDDAADEIERLAEELKQVESEDEHHMRLAFIDAGANPARTWREEAERLDKLLDSYVERGR